MPNILKKEYENNKNVKTVTTGEAAQMQLLYTYSIGVYRSLENGYVVRG
jgi:hypothetical protein